MRITGPDAGLGCRSLGGPGEEDHTTVDRQEQREASTAFCPVVHRDAIRSGHLVDGLEMRREVARRVELSTKQGLSTTVCAMLTELENNGHVQESKVGETKAAGTGAREKRQRPDERPAS